MRAFHSSASCSVYLGRSRVAVSRLCARPSSRKSALLCSARRGVTLPLLLVGWLRRFYLKALWSPSSQHFIHNALYSWRYSKPGTQKADRWSAALISVGGGLRHYLFWWDYLRMRVTYVSYLHDSGVILWSDVEVLASRLAIGDSLLHYVNSSWDVELINLSACVF
jgi:hypothetical protein